jgi:hypothetical protein
MTAQPELPQVTLGRGCRVSRLMIGSNQLSGFSHLTPERDVEMLDFYTSGRILELFRRCEELGLRSAQLRGDRFMARLWREHRNAGGRLAWVAQTASELADQAAHVKQLAGWGASGIYLHGTWVDNCWHAGRFEEVGELLKRLRDTGVAAGLGTHQPRVIEHVEERGWDLDFYMACLYNLSKGPKRVAATQGLDGSSEEYLAADREAMCRTIRATKRPCLAFKLLAAGRNTRTKPELRAAFEYAYANIKPSDGAIIGVFQRDSDELAEDVAIVREILSRGGPSG